MKERAILNKQHSNDTMLPFFRHYSWKVRTKNIQLDGFNDI